MKGLIVKNLTIEKWMFLAYAAFAWGLTGLSIWMDHIDDMASGSGTMVMLLTFFPVLASSLSADVIMRDRTFHFSVYERTLPVRSLTKAWAILISQIIHTLVIFGMVLLCFLVLHVSGNEIAQKKLITLLVLCTAFSLFFSCINLVTASVFQNQVAIHAVGVLLVGILMLIAYANLKADTYFGLMENFWSMTQRVKEHGAMVSVIGAVVLAGVMTGSAFLSAKWLSRKEA